MTTTPPPDWTASAHYQLGVATELLRTWLDGPNALITKVCGPEEIRRQTREFLASRGEQGMGPDETAARAAVAALRSPWPSIATGGLEPGDAVIHPDFDEVGRLAAFNDEEWLTAHPLVCHGQVLVEFEDSGRSRLWLKASALTAVPGERDVDWQRRHEIAEQTYLHNIEHAQYDTTGKGL